MLALEETVFRFFELGVIGVIIRIKSVLFILSDCDWTCNPRHVIKKTKTQTHVHRQTDIICTSWIIISLPLPCESCINKKATRLLVRAVRFPWPQHLTPPLTLLISSRATLPMAGLDPSSQHTLWKQNAVAGLRSSWETLHSTVH